MGMKKPTGSLYHLSHGQREPVSFWFALSPRVERPHLLQTPDQLRLGEKRDSERARYVLISNGVALDAFNASFPDLVASSHSIAQGPCVFCSKYGRVVRASNLPHFRET